MIDFADSVQPRMYALVPKTMHFLMRGWGLGMRLV